MYTRKTSQDVLRPSLTTNHISGPHSLKLAHMFSVGFNYDWNTIFSGVNGGFTIFSSMPIPHVGVCKTLCSHHFQWPGVYDVPYASQNMSKLCLETKFQGLRLIDIVFWTKFMVLVLHESMSCLKRVQFTLPRWLLLWLTTKINHNHIFYIKISM